MPDLTVAVDWRLAEPVYEQIARQIRTRIAAGDLPPGALLPAVRTLASDLGVNLNTVARAYRLLEEQRFVRIRERHGAEVSAPHGRADRETREALRAELHSVLARLRQAGVAPDEIRRLAEREIASLAGPAGKED